MLVAVALLASAATGFAPASGGTGLQVYNHTYCLTTPSNHFAHVDDGSLDACRLRCEQMKCPCFDYSTKVWALGKCRVVGSGVPFKLGSSCSGDDCETSFVPGGYHGTVPTPFPPPPPAPAPVPLPVLPPAPPAGECVWDSAKGTGPADTKTACHPMAPDIDLTTTLAGTHAAAQNVTHVDIQTVLYRTEPPLVDAKKSRVSVAAIPAGGCDGCDFFAPDGPQNCSEQFSLIELAGQKGADVAVLPEEFLWNTQSAPPADCDMSPVQNCSIINALGAIAKKHSMYIVFGMRAPNPANDPYEPDPARVKGRKLGYNTDVIIDRKGKMVGYYRKSWPCCPSPDGGSMNDGYPSREMVKTFDLDFGRVGLQTCFDMNFDDTWHQLYAANVDLVFWPSAYGGGMPIRGYAQVYHYNIVPVGWGDITDITGQVAQGLHAVVPKKMYMATLDLDRTYTHDDFVAGQVEQLVKDHAGLVEFISVPEHCSTAGHCTKTADLVRESGFYLLGRTDKGYEQGISVRKLLKEYNIESLRQYQHRARAALNMQRQAAAPHPTLLKRNDSKGGAFLHECKYNSDDSSAATKFGANVTCEPLVPDADASVSMHTAAGAQLNDVLYVDTRTTVYTEPPPLLLDPKKSRIKVASIAGLQCCVPAAQVNSSLQTALAKLETAGKLGADVALLPEEFMCGEAQCALEIDGPEVAQLSAMAKKHSMWIVFGMRAAAPAGDPYPVDPVRGPKKLGYNTDVILNRQGENIGYYRKSWPCCPGPTGTTMDDGYPSRELVKTFDTEFGRVGLQTCFDMNFMDTWHELYAQHTDIVFWPSAYGGGMPIRGYAKLFHYNIVPAGWGDITDTRGLIPPDHKQEAPGIFTATLDLDKTWFHSNFNDLGKMMNAHKGDLVLESAPGYCSTDGNCSSVGDILQESSFFLVARTDAGYQKGISVRALKDQYGLTDLATYQHQARHAINMQRMTAAPSVSTWPYATNGSSSARTPGTSPSKGSAETSADVDAVEDLRQGGGFEEYTMSTEPETRAFESSGVFRKAEGSKGWRGVV